MSDAAAGPAIELEHVSKRYRGAGRPIPVPRILRRRSRGAFWAPRTEAAEDVDVDDDLGEEEMEDEAEAEVAEGLAEGEEVWALTDISLRVEPGTVLGVLGANGSGKTTLMRVLAGMTPVTEGRVTLRGRVSPLMSAAPAFMQPQMTGRENIYFLAELFGVPREVAARRVDAIAEFADVSALLDLQLKTYSSGLYKRLAVAISLLLEPDVLLADELPSIGDVHFREQFRRHLESECREGLTLVLASHDLRTVRDFCSEAVLLDEGRIVERGDVETIIDLYETIRARARRSAIPDGRPDGAEPLRRAEVGGAGAGLFALDGEPAEAVHADDEAIVEMGLLVRAPGLELLGTLSVRAPGGEVVIRSRMREPWAATEGPGLYLITMFLPARLLADGPYDVTSRVTIFRDGERIGKRQHEAFSFEVFGGGEQPPPERFEAPLKLPWAVFYEGASTG